MHNRRKPEHPLTASELQALEEKKLLYSNLVNIVWKYRVQSGYSADALLVLSKLLVINPDFYSLWNYRREILLKLYPMLQVTIPQDPRQRERWQGEGSDDMAKEELTVTQKAIQRNPKCYGAWHHRLWILERVTVNYESELTLCETFLRHDQRNFHCWNYRRAVVGLMHQQEGNAGGGDEVAQQELGFALTKIEENFSNYSAFHHRSVYLSQLFRSPTESGEDYQSLSLSNMESIRSVFNTEWTIIMNAIYTEPDDQSAWWYYQFLLTWLCKLLNFPNDTKPIDTATQPPKDVVVWMVEQLQDQGRVIEELLQVESQSKWCMISLVNLHAILVRLYSWMGKVYAGHAEDRQDEINTSALRRYELLEQLLVTDPWHQNRYRYLLSKPIV